MRLLLASILVSESLACLLLFLCFPPTNINFLLQLKKKLQIYTLGVGGIGLVSSYISYSPEVAARSVFDPFLHLFMHP